MALPSAVTGASGVLPAARSASKKDGSSKSDSVHTDAAGGSCPPEVDLAGIGPPGRVRVGCGVSESLKHPFGLGWRGYRLAQTHGVSYPEGAALSRHESGTISHTAAQCIMKARPASEGRGCDERRLRCGVRGGMNVNVPGAGTEAGHGTIPYGINAAGAIIGWYVDANNVDHGFVRDSWATSPPSTLPARAQAPGRERLRTA